MPRRMHTLGSKREKKIYKLGTFRSLRKVTHLIPNPLRDTFKLARWFRVLVEARRRLPGRTPPLR